MAGKKNARVSLVDVDAVVMLLEDRAALVPAPVAAVEVRRRPQRTRRASETITPLPAKRTSRRASGRDENLSEYLSSLGRIPLLSADDEQRIASQLRDAEVGCWIELLGSPQALALVDQSELISDNPELKSLVERIGAMDGADSPIADVEALADALRENDDDRVLIDAVIAALDKSKAPGLRSLLANVRSRRARAVSLRNSFVRANLRLVVSVARRFHHYRLPLIDLIQEGNLGLIKSVHRFDHRKGFRFSTYAHWWIRQAIERAIMNKGAQVRLPVHIFDARREVAKATRDLQHQLGRDPTHAELSTALAIPTDKLDEILRAVPREPQSLDEPVGDDEDRTVGEIIANDGAAPDEEVIRFDEEAFVMRMLTKLSPMEVDIIRRRYGLGSDDDETLEEIGRTYQLSRERVRQIQVQGLKKIQAYVGARHAVP